MNRIVIVTGASRGIGAATARLAAREGFAVAVVYNKGEAPARAVVADIEKAGGRAIAVHADTAVETDVLRLFETVERDLGPPTALVNNAAIHGPRGRFEALTADTMAEILRVNVIGYMLCAREAIKRMSTRHGGKGGVIVNISSGSANTGAPGEGVLYGASKGAVNSLTTGLAQEVAAEGIRVSAVSPGLTRTDMPPADKLAEMGPRQPMGRVGEAGEIAEAIVWLLSDRASFVAGANIRVSGGKP